MFLFLLVILSSFLIIINHPLMMTMFLISSTILISTSTFLFVNSPWFSMILFLVILGGVLILFLYMASISPNSQMIKVNPFILLSSSSMLIMALISFPISPPPLSSSIQSHMLYSSLPLIIFLTFYLILVLLIISSMVKTFQGPLRSSI